MAKCIRCQLAFERASKQNTGWHYCDFIIENIVEYRSPIKSMEKRPKHGYCVHQSFFPLIERSHNDAANWFRINMHVACQMRAKPQIIYSTTK